MFCRVFSMALNGLEGYLVSVETDISNGLPCMELLGSSSAEVKEARARVRTSLRHEGIFLPPKRITVNLSPGGIRKSGTGFDLAIAVGLLVNMELVAPEGLSESLFLGELSLDGRVQPVSGVLPMLCSAKSCGIKSCFVPEANRREGAAVRGLEVYGVKNITELLLHLRGVKKMCAEPCITRSILKSSAGECEADFSEVAGQATAVRGAEIAAAGMHNLILSGPPGTGKSLIARCIPGILPELDEEECLKITKIYSITGLLTEAQPLITKRPFRRLNANISRTALLGGGYFPRPGELSLAEGGVLFWDEMPEASRGVLDALRQPLEDRFVTIPRASGACVFPADIMLVGTMNNCPCGHYPDRKKCRCSQGAIDQYQSRISKALLERIDMQLEVRRISIDNLEGSPGSEPSRVIRKRVQAAHKLQKKRFRNTPLSINSQMTSKNIDEYCKLEQDAEKILRHYIHEHKASLRTYHGIKKIARTIADLDGDVNIHKKHVSEALIYQKVCSS